MQKGGESGAATPPGKGSEGPALSADGRPGAALQGALTTLPLCQPPGERGGPTPHGQRAPHPPQPPAVQVQRWALRSTVRSSPAWSGQSFVDHRAPGRKQVTEGTWLQAPRARPAWFHSRATPPQSANHPAHIRQGPHEHEPPRPSWDLGCHRLAVSWRRPPQDRRHCPQVSPRRAGHGPQSHAFLPDGPQVAPGEQGRVAATASRPHISWAADFPPGNHHVGHPLGPPAFTFFAAFQSGKEAGP